MFTTILGVALAAISVASASQLQERLLPEPPRPAACTTVKMPTSRGRVMVDHDPYPEVGKPWPIDLASAEIILDPVKPSRPQSLTTEWGPRLTVADVRERLGRYRVLPGERWRNDYSHVGGLDQGGWLIAMGQCYRWTVRPGGLAFIVYPDGTVVHLFGCCRK